MSTAFLDGGGLEAMLELSKIGEGTISGYCTATLYALAKDERTRMKCIKRGDGTTGTTLCVTKDSHQRTLC